jgi:putative methionine-R-sulfoxide reductase with GAF domain
MRDYSPLIDKAIWMTPRPGSRGEAMSIAVELLWKAFAHKPISWVGFYEKVEDADEMVLVCREPKPACSPIGMHGMCGRGYLKKESIIIADVRTLGENYIACDPKDQSELVVPMMLPDGRCKGVLDVDSYEVGAFVESDARAMERLLMALGLTKSTSPLVKL